MIKSLSVANFRSIKSLTKLDFSKSNRKKSDLPHYAAIGQMEIAYTSALYGANASGKSNLLRAFRGLEYLVISSSKFQAGDRLEPYEPFKLAEDTRQNPVFFELEFFIDQVRYQYSLSFLVDRIETEKLTYFPMGREAVLFNRVNGREIQFGEYFKGEKKTIEKITLPNQLFLSKASENNAESVMPIFQFFRNNLRVYPFINQYKESGLERYYAKRIAEEPDAAFARKLNALICALDTGIRSIRAKETDWSSVRFPDALADSIRRQFQEEFKYEIKTVHDSFDAQLKQSGFVEFDIDEESTGTRSLLSIGGIIIDALEKGLVLVIDEFEKNLHPMITAYLIHLFNDAQINKKNAQLIFATHDVTQLNEDMFNRDQVWFSQKNEFGITELIRCSEIKGLRIGNPLEKWYLSGRLGGTAVINDSDFLIAMQEETEWQA